MNKTTLSPFLMEIKPLLRRMINDLTNHFQYVSILGTDTDGKDFSVRSKGISVVDSNWKERGFVVRVFRNSRYSEYSFNDINENNYLQHIQTILDHNRLVEEEISNHLMNPVLYPLIEEESLTGTWQSEVVSPFENLETNQIIEQLTTIKNQLHEVSPLIVNAGVSLQTIQVSKVFVSSKKELMQAYTWSDSFMFACAQKENKYRMGMRIRSGLVGAEILQDLVNLTKEVVEEAIMLLDSERIIPGTYDVICSPDVAGLIAHEAFGHGVEQDMYVKNRAKAVEYMGKPVASKLVDMHDGSLAATHISSYWFDDEGVMGSDTKIIDKGILKSGINDLLSASLLKVSPTGNGKRESFERKAYTRMTNTFFSPGKDKLEDMIKSIEFGYLLDNPESGMEDPKNWGIQCVISFGREIKQGQLTGKVVAPVIMTGYVPDLLSSISMVSSDLHLEGSGACGKGHKEYVKVSAGGPYIKAKARLS